MSMTPEEIDKIYIQEHGMTKGAFSVGLQGSLMHRNSVEEWAEGDPVKVCSKERTPAKSLLYVSHMRADVGGTIKRRTTVLPGGKQERRASRPLFFLYI